MILDSFIFSTAGGRDENQDAAGKLEGEGCGLYVVADGLGGHANGRLAAESVVSTLLNGEKPQSLEELCGGIAAANSAILELQSRENCTAKSTVAALLIRGESAFWAHTGDSRIYGIHDGRLTLTTNDHSVSYKKYQSGEITKRQIAADEDQSRLLKALGGTKRWEPETGTVEGVAPGDAFLLCSDGFWEYVNDEEMLVDYLKASSARQWARLMLLRAIGRVKPGHDNLTLMTVLVSKGH